MKKTPSSKTQPASTPPVCIEPVDGDQASSQAPGRREFLGRSGKLLIYVPPAIQLFIPTKALAASPSS